MAYQLSGNDEHFDGAADKYEQYKGQFAAAYR